MESFAHAACINVHIGLISAETWKRVSIKGDHIRSACCASFETTTQAYWLYWNTLSLETYCDSLQDLQVFSLLFLLFLSLPLW